MDTAVSEIRYNFTGSTPSTTVAFTYDEMNGGGLRTVDLMNVGFYRPSRIDVRQGSTTVLYSYLFTYHPLGFHYYGPWEISTQFWMLASISKIGAGGSGALPAQTFTYEMTPFGGCASGDNQGETNYCVQALKRVDNGYGAVTEFSFTKIDNKWMHVTTADTWDGVAAKYGSGARPQSRLSYDRAGQVACYDNTGSACHLGLTPPSGALVGFDGVTILSQAPSGASAWTSLGKQVVTFENDNYWLLGRISSDERHIPGGVRVSRSVYEWVDAGEAYIQLDFETHATYDPLNVSRFTIKTIDYEYYPYTPGSGQYGGLKERREIDEADNPYRCTQYEYAQNTAGGNWLINYPLRETLYSGTCTGTRVSETLYRYAGSANPQQQALDNRGLLTYVLRLRDTASNGYSTEKLTYTAQGLQESIITFGTDSTTTAYSTDTRNTTTTTYNTLGMPTRVETTAAGVTKQTDTIDYDATFAWLVAKITDSNSIFTQYDYDNFGRLSMVAMPGDSLTTNGATIRYDYYDDGSTKFVSPLLVGVFYKGGIRSDERQFYDGLGRLVQTQTAEVAVEGSGDKDIVSTTSYDARGLAVCATVHYAVAPYVYNPNNPVTPFQTTACTAKSRTTTTYDALGRATQVTTPDGAATGTAYGVSTNITVDGHTRFQSTQVTDANAHRTVNYTDVFGRLALVRENTGSGTYTAYADTRYSYDVTGNLTAVKRSAPNNNQPGSFLWQTSMGYDPLGRKTTMSDPDMREWSYSYDSAGNLARQEHHTGTTVHHATCFYYDNLNRLLHRSNDDTPANACPANAPTNGANYLAGYVYGTSKANRNIGKPVEVNWGAIPTENRDTFTYDAEGRLGTQTRKVNNQTFVYEVTVYDVLDRPTSVELPGGEVVTTTYDEEGVNTLAAGAMSLISKVGYNERGQLALLERPGAGPETTLSYYGAADNFRLSGIANSGDGNLPDFSYGNYDAIGNLTQFTAGADSYTYTYDEQDRLKTVTGAIGRDYTYDLLGNFDSVTKGGQVQDYTYAAGNASRLMSVTNLPLTVDPTAGYDTWGNLRKYTLGGVAYELNFNAENRLASVKVGAAQPTVFAYDADGQRVQTTYPDGTIVYTPFPDYEVTDPPTGSNTVRTTYRLGGQIVAVQTKVGTAAGTFYYTYTDHLGNITALSTTGGAYVTGSNARYDPFGTFTTTTPTSNPSISNHGFTGHRHNNTGTNDLDLIYMNARYFMPLVGRFISPDTIVAEPGNPQSYNRYSYSLNNPINYIDPSGHCVLLPPIDTAACAIAAGSSIGAGTFAAGAAAVALTVAIGDAISPDFNLAAGIANLIGDISEGAENLGQEIMENLAGPSASGNPNDLEPQKPDNPSKPDQSKESAKVNTKGIEYPKQKVEGYGEVPFPKGNIEVSDPAPIRAQFTSQYRIQFRNWWQDNYGWYPSPDKYDIHHIQPLSRGGTNDFSNLVPLERGAEHAQFTEWWLSYP